MNNALSRLLLTCLLAVALPLNGLAASSLLACGPNHHSDTAAVAHAHGALAPAHSRTHAHGHATATGPAHGHDHGDGAAHAHAAVHDTGSSAGASGVATGSTVAADQAPDLKVKAKCGTCAPCCVSAALTGGQSHRLAQAASSADFPAFAAGHASPPTGRLDRPPRSLLA